MLQGGLGQTRLRESGNLCARSGPNHKEIVQERIKSGGFGAFVGGLGQTELQERKKSCEESGPNPATP